MATLITVKLEYATAIVNISNSQRTSSFESSKLWV